MNRANPANTTDLLNELAKGAGCYYLSDLHDRENAAAVTAALGGISLARFTLAEWQEAVRYILKTDDCPADTVTAAVDLLKQRLGQTK